MCFSPWWAETYATNLTKANLNRHSPCDTFVTGTEYKCLPLRKTKAFRAEHKCLGTNA